MILNPPVYISPNDNNFDLQNVRRCNIQSIVEQMSKGIMKRDKEIK